MIVLNSVSKAHGRSMARRLVLDDIDAVFQSEEHYVVLGRRGSGKSTLLRLLCGIQHPTRGRIRRYCGVSLPAGSAASLAGNKTGTELATFIARLYDADPVEVGRFTATFSGLGDQMAFPLTALSPIARARLGYALTYAIPTDVYLFDDTVAYGDAQFRRSCLQAFENRRRDCGTIVATRDSRQASRLGERGALLHQGKLFLFDAVADAVAAYQEIELSEHVAGLPYAEALVRNGDPDKAREHLKEHLSQNDGVLEAFELLAQLSLRAGQYSDAMEASKAVIERAPDSPGSHFILAKVAEQRRRLEAAILHAEKVLELAPGHHEARVLLAKAYESTGMNKEAAALWRSVGASGRDPVSLRLAIRNDLKGGSWEGVLSTVELALAHQPNDASLLVVKVRALLELRRWAEAGQVIGYLASVDAEKVVGAIYHLTKTADWAIIPEMLRLVPSAALYATRTSRTSRLLVTSLERQAVYERKQGRIEAATALRNAIAMLDPDRLPPAEGDRTAAPGDNVDEQPGDLAGLGLATPDSIVRELFELRSARPGMDATEFAARQKAAWAAAKAYLAGRRDGH